MPPTSASGSIASQAAAVSASRARASASASPRRPLEAQPSRRRARLARRGRSAEITVAIFGIAARRLAVGQQHDGQAVARHLDRARHGRVATRSRRPCRGAAAPGPPAAGPCGRRRAMTRYSAVDEGAIAAASKWSSCGPGTTRIGAPIDRRGGSAPHLLAAPCLLARHAAGSRSPGRQRAPVQPAQRGARVGRRAAQHRRHRQPGDGTSADAAAREPAHAQRVAAAAASRCARTRARVRSPARCSVSGKSPAKASCTGASRAFSVRPGDEEFDRRRPSAGCRPARWRCAAGAGRARRPAARRSGASRCGRGPGPWPAPRATRLRAAAWRHRAPCGPTAALAGASQCMGPSSPPRSAASSSANAAHAHGLETHPVAGGQQRRRGRRGVEQRHRAAPDAAASRPGFPRDRWPSGRPVIATEPAGTRTRGSRAARHGAAPPAGRP